MEAILNIGMMVQLIHSFKILTGTSIISSRSLIMLDRLLILERTLMDLYNYSI